MCTTISNIQRNKTVFLCWRRHIYKVSLLDCTACCKNSILNMIRVYVGLTCKRHYFSVTHSVHKTRSISFSYIRKFKLTSELIFHIRIVSLKHLRMIHWNYLEYLISIKVMDVTVLEIHNPCRISIFMKYRYISD